MNVRKHLVEAVTLIVAAVLCAVVANAMASRERKIAVVGNYPNALKVPEKTAEPAPRVVTDTTPLTTPLTTTGPVVATAPATVTTTTATVAPSPRPLAPGTAHVTAPKSTPAASPAPAPAADLLTRFPPHEKQPYIEIHGGDVAWLHDKGVLFLDARRTSVYEDGHIAGSRPFSVWESDVDDKVNRLFEEHGGGNDPKRQSQPIVVYCSGGDCEDSHMLAEKLYGVLFNNVYVYKDGYPDWVKRGGATVKGDKP